MNIFIETFSIYIFFYVFIHSSIIERKKNRSNDPITAVCTLGPGITNYFYLLNFLMLDNLR